MSNWTKAEELYSKLQSEYDQSIFEMTIQDVIVHLKSSYRKGLTNAQRSHRLETFGRNHSQHRQKCWLEASARQISHCTSFVLVDGEFTEVPDDTLVPGDIVFLCRGKNSQADVRILNGAVMCYQANLTGEAELVQCQAIYRRDKPKKDKEQRSRYFGNTPILGGYALGIVYGTGKYSTYGAGLLYMEKEPSCAKKLGAACVERDIYPFHVDPSIPKAVLVSVSYFWDVHNATVDGYFIDGEYTSASKTKTDLTELARIVHWAGEAHFAGSGTIVGAKNSIFMPILASVKEKLKEVPMDDLALTFVRPSKVPDSKCEVFDETEADVHDVNVKFATEAVLKKMTHHFVGDEKTLLSEEAKAALAKAVKKLEKANKLGVCFFKDSVLVAMVGLDIPFRLCDGILAAYKAAGVQLVVFGATSEAYVKLACNQSLGALPEKLPSSTVEPILGGLKNEETVLKSFADKSNLAVVADWVPAGDGDQCLWATDATNLESSFRGGVLGPKSSLVGLLEIYQTATKLIGSGEKCCIC